jgi:hypothetical protein
MCAVEKSLGPRGGWVGRAYLGRNDGSQPECDFYLFIFILFSFSFLPFQI